MTCSDFLTRFTDYLDGTAREAEVKRFEAHLLGCASCRRYRVVLERGADLLRSLPELEVAEDFEPRLRHRMYHVADARGLAGHQSGTFPMTVLTIAVLLTALAWAPVLRGAGRDVLIDPIVVDRAPSDADVILPILLVPRGADSRPTPAALGEGLWENTRLYQYSPLSQRYDRRARFQRVADFDR